MASDLQHVPDGYRRELDRLAEIEERLDAEVRFDDQRFAGLRDYRTVLELATVRLSLATLAVETGGTRSWPAPRRWRRCRRWTTCAGCRCPTTSPS